MEISEIPNSPTPHKELTTNTNADPTGMVRIKTED